MINPLSSFPVYIVDNIVKAKDFYTKYLGFQIAFENEWYLHLVSESGVQIGFMLPEQPTQPEIFKKAYTGIGTIFSIEVENAKLAYADTIKNSLNIVLELRSEDWGQHHFCIEDPNGIHIDVIESFEPTQEYQ